MTTLYSLILLFPSVASEMLNKQTVYLFTLLQTDLLHENSAKAKDYYHVLKCSERWRGINVMQHRSKRAAVALLGSTPFFITQK